MWVLEGQQSFQIIEDSELLFLEPDECISLIARETVCLVSKLLSLHKSCDTPLPQPQASTHVHTMIGVRFVSLVLCTTGSEYKDSGVPPPTRSRVAVGLKGTL